MLYQILKGPPHHEFFASLELGGIHEERRMIEFTIQPQNPPPGSTVIKAATTWPAMIDGVEREDGSGHTWNFSAWMANKRVKGFYNTNTRKGTVEIPA